MWRKGILKMADSDENELLEDLVRRAAQGLKKRILLSEAGSCGVEDLVRMDDVLFILPKLPFMSTTTGFNRFRFIGIIT